MCGRVHASRQRPADGKLVRLLSLERMLAKRPRLFYLVTPEAAIASCPRSLEKGPPAEFGTKYQSRGLLLPEKQNKNETACDRRRKVLTVT